MKVQLPNLSYPARVIETHQLKLVSVKKPRCLEVRACLTNQRWLSHWPSRQGVGRSKHCEGQPQRNVDANHTQTQTRGQRAQARVSCAHTPAALRHPAKEQVLLSPQIPHSTCTPFFKLINLIQQCQCSPAWTFIVRI